MDVIIRVFGFCCGVRVLIRGFRVRVLCYYYLFSVF